MTSFAILPGSTGFWIERFVRYAIPYTGPVKREVGGAEPESVISFKDPDGLLLELVSSAGAEARPAWANAHGIPQRHAIHGFHSVTLWVEKGDATEEVLTETLGFRPLSENGSTRRFTAGNGEAATFVDVRTTGGFVRSVGGAGTVHHVAWSVPDDASQLALRERVLRSGLSPTHVIDRRYFHSVYFREPAGILYELATIPPGFTIDEPVDRLGERLMLPPQFEADRAAIVAGLPEIHLPRPASEDSFLPAGS